MQYGDKVIDHFTNPRNVGSMDKAASDVGTGIVGAPECGDVLKLQIQVDQQGKIVDAKFGGLPTKRLRCVNCNLEVSGLEMGVRW